MRERLVQRSYKAGEVLWRTRGPGRFLGFVQNGEIEVEYRFRGILVRSRRLFPGDPVPPRSLHSGSRHATILARALTDVSLCIVPETEIGQARAATITKSTGSLWLKRAWPFVLLLLIVGIARADMVRIASGLLFMASNHERYDRLDDARSMNLLKFAEEVDSSAAFAYNEEGYRWFQQERLPNAEAAFMQAVESDPAHAPALNNMAITYFSRGDLPSAARYLQQAVEHAPDNALVRYNLGITLMQLHEHAQAIREFREADFIEPEDPAPPLQQAFLYIQTEDYQNAESRARTAIQRDPSRSSAHLLLAIALYKQDRYTEALVSIADTLALEPQNRVALFYQALLLRRVGQYDAALSILEHLLATASDHLEEARILVEIEANHRSLSELQAAAR